MGDVQLQEGYDPLQSGRDIPRATGRLSRSVTECGQRECTASGFRRGLMPKLTSVFAATLLIPRLRPPWGLTTSLRQVYVGSSCDCPAPRLSHSEQLASIRPSGPQGRGIIYRCCSSGPHGRGIMYRKCWCLPHQGKHHWAMRLVLATPG